MVISLRFRLSHFGLDVVEQRFQLVHVCLLRRPFYAQSFCLIWLWNLRQNQFFRRLIDLVEMRGGYHDTMWKCTYQVIGRY